MSNDRTTVNVDQETHRKARDVKEEHNDSWPDVLEWYAENRDKSDTEETSVDTEAIDELQETLENLDIERVGQSMVQVNQLSEEIGRLQDQVNQLEKTLEGLR